MKNKKIKFLALTIATFGLVGFSALNAAYCNSIANTNSTKSVAIKTSQVNAKGDTFEADLNPIIKIKVVCTVTDDADSAVSIKMLNKSEGSGNLIIPSTIKNADQKSYSITGISDEGFLGTKFTSISFATSIKTIGARAFKDSTIKALHGATTDSDFSTTSITSIGESAFEGCSNLEQALKLPETDCTVGNYAFKGISCTQVNIPDKKYTFGSYVFSGSLAPCLHVHVASSSKDTVKSMVYYETNIEGTQRRVANYVFATGSNKDSNPIKNDKIRVYLDGVTEDQYEAWREESVELWDGHKEAAFKLWESWGIAAREYFAVKSVNAIEWKDAKVDDIISSTGKRIQTPNLSSCVIGDNGLPILDSLSFTIEDASKLPEGLSFDSRTGIVSGIAKKTCEKTSFAIGAIFNTGSKQIIIDGSNRLNFTITINESVDPIVLSDSQLEGIAGDTLLMTATLNPALIQSDLDITWSCFPSGFLEFDRNINTSKSGEEIKFKLLRKTNSENGIKIVASCAGQSTFSYIKINNLPEIEHKTQAIQAAIIANAVVFIFLSTGLYYLIRNINTRKKIKSCTVSSDVATRYKKFEQKKAAKKGTTYNDKEAPSLIKELENTKKVTPQEQKEESLKVKSADISDESYNVYTSLLSKTKTIEPEKTDSKNSKEEKKSTGNTKKI